ncbi:MAG: cytochrome c biogenesis heme-transporting ATPase CcmA [Cellvibrionaceae bacterium]|nr:cytochrome c biogenesis heme-transporting ATPase CcmA [Cellvibrionaceae bacterium]
MRQLRCERDGRLLFGGLDVCAQAGDIVYIQGPNGAGKTTLLRSLAGLFSAYQGDILWRGRAINKVKPAYLSQLLFIGHLSGIKKTLTPRENLRLFTQIHPLSSDGRIDESLAQVGLYGYEDMPGYQLSAGQLKRVALARLYLSRASLWLLDEPYTAIDQAGIAQLEQLFRAHVATGGLILLTSHQAPTIAPLKSIRLVDSVDGSEL